MPFPEGFLWGSATAAHQVEGNNLAADFWTLEHLPTTRFAEPSGDAVDHYRLFRSDIELMREIGLKAFRFSIEWARVEPEDGYISRAAIAHYREVLEACHANGLTPVVTLHHFTSPRWLITRGGWAWEQTPERFANYVRTVMEELGDLIPYACTLNEANIAEVIKILIASAGRGRRLAGQAPVGLAEDHLDGPAPQASAPAAEDAMAAAMRQAAAEAAALGVAPDNLNLFLFTVSDQGQDVIKRSHIAARDAIRQASPGTQVGISLALQDVQALPGGEKNAEAMWADLFESFASTIADDDFLGVQTYSRVLVDAEGVAPVPDDAETTLMGSEFYPQSLGNVLRRAASAGLPLMVTENGIATADDTRRAAYITEALEGVERCLDDGVDVRGYLHWSALDNFEWMLGYRPTFGLIVVDRATQIRTVKPSARLLGEIAQRNAIRP